MSRDIRENREERASTFEQDTAGAWKKSADVPPSLEEIREELASVKEGDTTEEQFETAGRVVAIREHGKSMFADLQEKNHRIQAYVNEDRLGEERFALFENIDIGDWIRVRGEGGKTRTGEPTIFAREFELFTKSLRPLPEKWHGLQDVEMRYRQRYLDLIANQEVMDTFLTRSNLLQEIRSYLTQQEFTEVETPMMHPIVGGAAARPFVTHHNTLDMDLYLRIAPELYLKRLLVGGMPKIFEINRNFRNEGISPQHNPEFTMLELYEAYGNYETMMELTETLIQQLCEQTLENGEIEFQDSTLDLSPPFRKETYRDLFEEHVEASWNDESDVKQLAEEHDIPTEDRPYGKIAHDVFEDFVEDELVDPTFVYDYPEAVSPFAKPKPDQPNWVERFELFVSGMEVANAFTELTDPNKQRAKLEQQLEEQEEGYKTLDEDFLTALEHGMPPAGGLGIGIDRLVMLLTESESIREVILFPQLRPEN